MNAKDARQTIRKIRGNMKKIPAPVYSAVLSAAAVCGIFAAAGRTAKTTASDERASIREAAKLERKAERDQKNRKKTADLLLRITAAVLERIPM